VSGLDQKAGLRRLHAGDWGDWCLAGFTALVALVAGIGVVSDLLNAPQPVDIFLTGEALIFGGLAAMFARSARRRHV